MLFSIKSVSGQLIIDRCTKFNPFLVAVYVQGHFQVGMSSYWLICAYSVANVTSKISITMPSGVGLVVRTSKKKNY